MEVKKIMVLEALEQIKKSEEQVENLKKESQIEIETYEKQKIRELELLRDTSSKRIADNLQAEQEAKETILLEEKESFSNEMQQKRTEYQKQFEQNKEAAITYVMERVENLYGSQ